MLETHLPLEDSLEIPYYFVVLLAVRRDVRYLLQRRVSDEEEALHEKRVAFLLYRAPPLTQLVAQVYVLDRGVELPADESYEFKYHFRHVFHLAVLFRLQKRRVQQGQSVRVYPSRVTQVQFVVGKYVFEK